MIAVFYDVDGTLVDCNTQLEAAKTFYKLKKISRLDILKVVNWIFLYKTNIVKDSTAIRKKTYKLLSQFSAVDADKIMDIAYSTSIRPRINKIFHQIIHQHELQGHRSIVISATINHLCKHTCEDFNLKEFYSTNLKIVNGKYSGEWIGEILEGENKLRFIRELARKENIDLSRSYAYADHESDFPMLNAVGHPIVVGNSKRIKRLALKNSWKSINIKYV